MDHWTVSSLWAGAAPLLLIADFQAPASTWGAPCTPAEAPCPLGEANSSGIKEQAEVVDVAIALSDMTGQYSCAGFWAELSEDQDSVQNTFSATGLICPEPHGCGVHPLSSCPVSTSSSLGYNPSTWIFLTEATTLLTSIHKPQLSTVVTWPRPDQSAHSIS